MARFDVFIAYARPDEAHARELFEALTGELGKDRVYFDREQPPGSSWTEEVPRALADSRMTVAVLTREPNGGWYDKSEFVLAIDEMRHGEHVVIPLFVDGTPERMRDWPYGLQGLSAIDAQGRGGLGQAAEEILKRLRALPAAGVQEAPRPRTRRELLNAALHLDRSDQWGAVQKIAQGHEHAYFLLYGQTFQNLRLFIERILHRLGTEVRPHLVLELPYRLDSTRPTNVHEWEHRLLWALKDRLNRRQGSLEQLLCSAVQTQPVFLVTALGWNEAFEVPHQQALRTFLETRLPELMASCGGQGIRLLLAAEYLQRESSRHRQITAWMRAGAASGSVHYEPMAEVETPRRGDVVVFLQRLGYDEGHPEFDAVMRGYDQLATDPRLDFRSLSDFLDAQLGDPVVVDDENDEEEYE